MRRFRRSSADDFQPVSVQSFSVVPVMSRLRFLFRPLCSLLAVAALCGVAFGEIPDEECMRCHGDAAKVKTVLNQEEIAKSRHNDLACTECHEGITKAEHEEKLPKVNCASCHEDEEKEFKGSVHDVADIPYEDLKPSCKGCHGTHGVLGKKSPKSKINPKNLPDTCGHCHTDARLRSKLSSHSFDPVAAYQQSVHNRPQKDDPHKVAATCIDCHGSHGIFPPLHPQSTISKFAIPQTCGKCHKKQGEEYQKSVHWKSASVYGHYVAPVCNDCHGEHSPVVPGMATTSDDPTSAALAASQLCAGCHSSPVLMSRFGLDPNRLASYMMTYHGLAVLRGSSRAARCTSCHEVHSIRSARDPESTVNANNLQTTCGKCHKNADKSFSAVSVHPINQKERNPIAYFFRVFYIWLIVLTIGGMLVHNLIIWAYYVRARWRAKNAQIQVVRFSMFQVSQHFLLFLSFTTLAVTGFALKFSGAWWAQALSAIGMSEPVRAQVHRGAGVVLILISLVQGIWFVTTRAGRGEILALIPRWYDLVGFFKTMRFYLFEKGNLPKHERYDYTEKAEYLALIWGTGVMAATGFVLWFPEFFLAYLPVWMFEVSEEIHFFEAMLAVLAIVVWHVFFTVIHPEHYPMNLTWVDGKVVEKKHGDEEGEE